jgi:hypothetical protein
MQKGEVAIMIIEILLLVAAVSGIAAMARGRGATPWLLGTLAVVGYIVLSFVVGYLTGSGIFGAVAGWTWVGLVAFYTRFVLGGRRTQPRGRWTCPGCRWLNAHYSVVCEACELPYGESPAEPSEKPATEIGTDENPLPASSNPYDPPTPMGDVPDVSHTDNYRPATNLVFVLTILLVLSIVLEFFLAALNLFVHRQYPEIFAGEEVASVTEAGIALVLFGFSLLSILISIAGLVLFFVWIYRAHDNVWALGAEKLEFTAGWCVGWFFIPFMNLFKPYQAMKEIYQASDPSADETSWPLVPVPAMLALWWVAWVVSALSGLAANRSTEIYVLSLFLAAASSVITLIVVRRIHANQQIKARGGKREPAKQIPGEQ